MFNYQTIMILDKEKIQKEVGKRVKSLRESKNISQVELADLCGFEKSNMARLESGGTNPTLFTLTKIAYHLNVSICDIIK